MRRAALGIALLTCCTSSDGRPSEPLVIQATMPRTDAVDVLLVLDATDSHSEERAVLADELDGLVERLTAGDAIGDRPPVRDLHVGVIDSNLGTGAVAVPTCGDLGDVDGRDGVLRTDGETLVAGCPAELPAVHVLPDGVDRSGFYQSLRCVVLGGYGCKWEQFLEATLKALTPSSSDLTFVRGGSHGDGANAGFRREDAVLAVLVHAYDDDCSVRDEELYDAESLVYDEPALNLRCHRFPEAQWPISRYTEGLTRLVGGNPSRLAYGVLGGVPADVAFYDDQPDVTAILVHPSMQAVVDPMNANGLRRSCDTPGFGVAFPPRRLLEVAEQLPPDRVTIGRCPGSRTGAIYRDELTAFARRIGDALGQVCLPQALPVDAIREGACVLTVDGVPLSASDWALVPGHDAACPERVVLQSDALPAPGAALRFECAGDP